jgi:hypothetical protein
MNTIGPGSLVALLKLALDIIFYVLWALLGLASLIIVMIMGAGAYRLLGLGSDLPRALEQFLAAEIVVAIPMGTVALGAIIFITDRLRRIFATLTAGDPFVPENAGHLRAIAVGIALYQLLSYASFGVISLVFTLSGNPVEGGSRVASEFSLNPGAWAAALAFLVLAEVFREGARLRDEQKFTI